jgi:hypothetical protein
VESEEEIAKPQARKNNRGKISELCGIVGVVFLSTYKKATRQQGDLFFKGE